VPVAASFHHFNMKTLKKVTRSLSFRLFLLLSGTLIVLSVIFTLTTVNMQSRQMMDVVAYNANATADLIRSSIHYSMLLNRKEDAYSIIQSISEEEHVLKIRLYNKSGIITYSTEPQEIKTEVDLKADACIICHDTTPPLFSIPYESRWKILNDEQPFRVLELTTPIENEQSCYQSGCHPAPEDMSVVGVLDVLISLDQVDSSIVEARNRMFYSLVALVLIVSAAFAVVLVINIGKPVKRLMAGTQQVAAGNFEYELPDDSRDELGELARSFNAMTRDLRTAHEEIKTWSETLEEKVKIKTAELKKAQSQLIQIEKMASVGQLSASVAHELNNPLEGILTYAKLIAKRIRKQEDLSERMKETLNDLDLITTETARCGNIVKNLLLFSKKEVGDFETTQLSTVIDKAVRLIQHHLRISKVELSLSISSDDIRLYCNPNQIQQALIALFVNAVEAMPDGGSLSVSASQSGKDADIMLKIADTGMGIPAEDIPHIFEPFFTKKKDGKGVGLGLSIVYGIIERHGGNISVESKVGEGTTFTVMFPATSRKDIHIEKEHEIHS
jgi:two-component system, NtrC family, sensor kinase